MESLTHDGFHAIVSTFSMLSCLGTARATLIIDHFLNAFALLSLAPLVWNIFNRNRWAIIVNGVIAGFVSISQHTITFGDDTPNFEDRYLCLL